MMIKMIVTRSRNTWDPIPVSSSLPGGLMTMEEMFQMVTTNNANIRPSALVADIQRSVGCSSCDYFSWGQYRVKVD